jgi:hypothetical protein
MRGTIKVRYHSNGNSYQHNRFICLCLCVCTWYVRGIKFVRSSVQRSAHVCSITGHYRKLLLNSVVLKFTFYGKEYYNNNELIHEMAMIQGNQILLKNLNIGENHYVTNH